ncbi:MAG: Na+/H+ antiporter NhaC family protein [Spirochaetia bacterium]
MESAGFWALIPPVIAVYCAITTKDVLVSLASGIVSGLLILAMMTGQNALTMFTGSVDLLAEKISDGWNARILLFCLLLGGIIGLLNRSGSAQAFGMWAVRFMKKRSSVLLFSWLLGFILFLDDYFSALSVGSAMRPIADEKKISRAKLSYFVHTTAPTVCVLVPFSSWVVTIISQIRGSVGFSELGMTEMDFFLRMIPYNFYILISLFLLLVVAFVKRDMNPMHKSEERAILEGKIMNEELYGACPANITHDNDNPRAKWFDMMIPLFVLITACLLSFPISGGFFSTDAANSLSFMDAVREADASKALAYGVIFTLILTYLYFLVRKIFTIQTGTNSVLEGMKSMIPAVMVLALAWMIGHIISKPISEGGVGLPLYIDNLLTKASLPLWLIPISMFIISSLIALATGTSWGTFGIMIPLTLPIAVTLAKESGLPADKMIEIVLISIGAVISGSVFGDNGSPISDTSILSSAGASCPLLEHVSTQFPYALLAAVSSGVSILVASFTLSAGLSLIVGLLCVSICFYFLSRPLPKIAEN